MKLDLVALAHPSPPNYGGAMDIFYKIQALAKMGAEIHLHSFVYGSRQPDEALAPFCATQHFYPRDAKQLLWHPRWPYIVSSRANRQLLHNLAQGQGPILFEGLHTTAFLGHAQVQHRPQWLRMHNLESAYYQALAEVEKNWLKRQYCRWEAGRLKRWEQHLQAAQGIFCLSQTEKSVFQSLYGNKVHFIPVFHGQMQAQAAPGRGDYLLYHGNLQVAENEHALSWLLDEVLCHLPYPLIVAGMNPSPRLKQKINSQVHWQLQENPSQEALNQLLRGAQIHLLPSFQATGVKLKLLHALSQGRHCLINTPMNTDQRLGTHCVVVDGAKAWQEAIAQYWPQAFTAEQQLARQALFTQDYNDLRNAEHLLAHLFR